MGDEFDGCECVWSHEFAMQRLLAMIRQSQNHCTDVECIDVSGRVRETTTGSGNEESTLIMTTMFMLFAVLMYFIRPESIRKYTKRHSQRQDSNGGLPPPPPPPAPAAIN
ncbi:small integral membrane protein 14 [Anastrepha ludens]|uniref:small integral membrane protein 14 n=1 Tax=Anastrepha ludens TaxID=28586 RepID=UPI0023AF0DBF|nr:small integral membrane protein 14 [Anastrepha ludens]XP_053965209.1 small integral membrane protein 14 [Anastrepha ludens]XP_053965210.1 small integral membrane protein 14 [Anastrepha ludens]XP_053965211.1 small integral membrane protein 14 [Anastrepha ludens]XP_053965212.1 small integral membrane protein 14 [Anastrepha ludens]